MQEQADMQRDIPEANIDQSHEVIDSLLLNNASELSCVCKEKNLVNLNYMIFIKEVITFRYHDKYFIRLSMSGFRLTKPRKFLFYFFVKSGWKDKRVENPDVVLKEMDFNREFFYRLHCKGSFYTAEYTVNGLTKDLVIDYVNVKLPTDKKLRFTTAAVNDLSVSEDIFPLAPHFYSKTQQEWDKEYEKAAIQFYISKNLNGTSRKELYVLYYVRRFYPDAISRYQFEGNSRKKIEADIFIPSLNTIIEYDGGFWHKNKVEIDNMKNSWFQCHGYKVIRIRDAELPELITVQGKVILHGVEHGGKHSDECIVDLIHYLSEIEENPNKKALLKKFTLTYQEYCDDELRLYDLVKERVEEQQNTRVEKRKERKKTVTEKPINNSSFRIDQYTFDGVYITSYCSYEEAGAAVNTNHINIYRACRGDKKSSAGYQWMRKSVDDEILDKIDPINISLGEQAARRMAQISLDGEILNEFQSVGEAVRQTGINSKSIRDAANGIQKTAGGFRWMYLS